MPDMTPGEARAKLKTMGPEVGRVLHFWDEMWPNMDAAERAAVETAMLKLVQQNEVPTVIVSGTTGNPEK